MARLGAKPIAASRRLAGKWVKTIVERRPKRSARAVAARNEAVWRTPMAKKTSPRTPTEVWNRAANQ